MHPMHHADGCVARVARAPTVFWEERMGVASDRVERAIIEMIEDGTLKPGDPIRHQWLASELGVSNNPVIQTLRRLEGLAVLEHMPSGETRVREHSNREIYAAYAVREAVEGMAARFCAELATEEEIAVLDVRHRKLDARYAQGEWAEQEEQAFHRGIVAFSHTPFLEHLHQSAMILRSTFRAHLVQGREIRDMIGLHRPIMAAVSARDPNAAEQAMRRHIREARESFSLRQFEPSATSAWEEHTGSG